MQKQKTKNKNQETNNNAILNPKTPYDMLSDYLYRNKIKKIGKKKEKEKRIFERITRSILTNRL